jgi:hypothetical protein
LIKKCNQMGGWCLLVFMAGFGQRRGVDSHS